MIRTVDGVDTALSPLSTEHIVDGRARCQQGFLDPDPGGYSSATFLSKLPTCLWTHVEE